MYRRVRSRRTSVSIDLLFRDYAQYLAVLRRLASMWGVGDALVSAEQVL